MNQSTSSKTMGRATPRQPTRMLELATAASPNPLKPFSLEKYMQRSLVSRIVIALTSASVSAAVLVLVVSLSRPMSAPNNGQTAAPTTNATPKPAKTRRMSLADDVATTARTA